MKDTFIFDLLFEQFARANVIATRLIYEHVGRAL